jgi:hypothetical protein
MRPRNLWISSSEGNVVLSKIAVPGVGVVGRLFPLVGVVGLLLFAELEPLLTLGLLSGVEVGIGGWLVEDMGFDDGDSTMAGLLGSKNKLIQEEIRIFHFEIRKNWLKDEIKEIF